MNETHEAQLIWWVELRWTGERTMRVEKVYCTDRWGEHIAGHPHLKITDPLVQDEIGAFNYTRRTLERLSVVIN